MKYILIVIIFFFSGCSDYFNIDDEKESETNHAIIDFTAGEQPVYSEYKVNAALLNPEVFNIKKIHYVLNFKIPKSFLKKKISEINNNEMAAVFDKSYFFKSEPLYFFESKTVSDKINKKPDIIIIVSQIYGFVEKYADLHLQKFREYKPFSNMDIKLTRLEINKKFVINQFLFFQKPYSENKSNKITSHSAISFIFKPTILENYEFLIISKSSSLNFFSSEIESLLASINIKDN